VERLRAALGEARQKPAGEPDSAKTPSSVDV
jgi:hypothetical protein